MNLNIKDFNHVGIKHLYHLTSINNLESILIHNLLSKSEIKKKWIAPEDISYQGVQNIRKEKYPYIFENHIPLFFNQITPMLYAKTNIHDSLLIIKFDIIDLEYRNRVNWGKSYFTDQNLVYTDAYQDSMEVYTFPLNIFSEIGWKSNTREDIFTKEAQCEFLFFHEIKKESISKIYVNNYKLQSDVQQIIKNFINKLNIDVQIQKFQLPGTPLDEKTLRDKYEKELERLYKLYGERPEVIERRERLKADAEAGAKAKADAEAKARKIEEEAKEANIAYRKSLSPEQLAKEKEKVKLLIEKIEAEKEEATKKYNERIRKDEQKIINEKKFKEKSRKHQNWVKQILKKFKLSDPEKYKLEKTIRKKSVEIYEKKFGNTNQNKLDRQEIIQKIQKIIFVKQLKK